jgi:multidrug resistance efflux pump
VLRRDTVISEDELARQRFGLATARARMEEARTDIAAEEAGLRATEVEIARSTVAAPTNATVLKVDVRPGEYVAAGVVARPPMILGGLTPLHVRADIDEHEGVRVRAGAAAEARPRGDPSRRFRLAFVRFEPFVIPKRSLTGDATERVDTRVLQAIYRIEGDVAGMYVGQQLDIFIEAARPVAAR